VKLISACLLGIRCNWRGDDAYKNDAAAKLSVSEEMIYVCPERMGGLDSPRAQMEIVGGDGHDVLDGVAKVMTSEGDDVTAKLVAGAETVLKLAMRLKTAVFIGKARSPSCGCGAVCNGTFMDKTIAGDGVTAALLIRNEIEVISDGDI